MIPVQASLIRPPVYGVELYTPPLLPIEVDEVYPNEKRFPLTRLPTDIRICIMDYLKVKEIVLFQQLNRNFKRMFCTDVAELSILRDSLSEMKLKILTAIDPFFQNNATRNEEFGQRLLTVRKRLEDDLNGMSYRRQHHHLSNAYLFRPIGMTEADKLWGFPYLYEMIRQRSENEEYSTKDILEYEPSSYVNAGYLCSTSLGALVPTLIGSCLSIPPMWSAIGPAIGCLLFQGCRSKFEQSGPLGTHSRLQEVNQLLIKEFLSFADSLPLTLPESSEEIIDLHQHIMSWISIDTNKMVWESLKGTAALNYWLAIKELDHPSNPCNANRFLSLKCTWLINMMRKMIQTFCQHQKIPQPVKFSQIHKGSPELTYYCEENDVANARDEITRNLIDVNSAEFQSMIVNALQNNQKALLELFVQTGLTFESLPLDISNNHFCTLMETGIFINDKSSIIRLCEEENDFYALIFFINGVEHSSLNQLLQSPGLQQHLNFNVLNQIREEGFAHALIQLPQDVKIAIEALPDFDLRLKGCDIREFRNALFTYCLYEMQRRGIV